MAAFQNIPVQFQSYAPSSQALSNVGDILRQYQDRELRREQMAQQAKADEATRAFREAQLGLQKAQFGFEQDKYAQSQLQNQRLANVLGQPFEGTPTITTEMKDTVIPPSSESEQIAASNRYTEAFNQLLPAAEQEATAALNPRGVITELTPSQKKWIENRAVNIAGQQALDRSGINQLQFEPRVEAIPTKVSTPNEPTRADMVSQLFKRIKHSGLDPENQTRAVKLGLEQIDALKPQASSSDIKYLNEQKQDIQTLADIKAANSNDPDIQNATTLESAKVLLSSKSKAKNKKDINVGEALYKGIDAGKDSGDASAIEAWMDKHRDRLKQYSPEAKAELVARILAQYGDEAEYFDLTDYFGGSPMGDVLSQITP